MKAECKNVAERLLTLDNKLASAVSELQHNDYRRLKESLTDAVLLAQLAYREGIITEQEAQPFLELTGPYERFLNLTIQALLSMSEFPVEGKQLEALHERAEGLLLEKVIACECGQGG